MGLDIYIVRGDAWPAYDHMVRTAFDDDAFQHFCAEHVFDCPAEWATRPGGTIWGNDFYGPGYIARGCMIYGTELHDRFLWDIFQFREDEYTSQDWPSVHREAERVLELYRAGKAGLHDDPGTSAELILEYIIRVSGWILEEPDPSAYRACYSR